MVNYYSNGEGKEDLPQSIAVASPELVAARFISKVQAHCTQADYENLAGRFPAWGATLASRLTRTENRLQKLVNLIASVELSGDKTPLGLESDIKSLGAGTHQDTGLKRVDE